MGAARDIIAQDIGIDRHHGAIQKSVNLAETRSQVHTLAGKYGARQK